jgi:hypothetical protein
MMLAFEFLFGVAAATLTITHGFQQHPFRYSIVENSCIAQSPQSWKRNKSIVSWKRVQFSTKSFQQQRIRRPTQQYYILGGDAFSSHAKLASRCTRLSTSVCYLASTQQKPSKSNNSPTNADRLVDEFEREQKNLNEGIATGGKKIFSQEFWCVCVITSCCTCTILQHQYLLLFLVFCLLWAHDTQDRRQKMA